MTSTVAITSASLRYDVVSCFMRSRAIVSSLQQRSRGYAATTVEGTTTRGPRPSMSPCGSGLKRGSEKGSAHSENRHIAVDRRRRVRLTQGEARIRSHRR